MNRLSLLVVLALLAAALAAAQTPDCSLAPGWKQEGPMRSYDADNLFEYMDGNAEGYIIYDFVSMKGVSCRSGEVTLVFDVSEMGSPEFAYGIFMSNRDPRAPVEKIGMAGQVLPRRGMFAKEKYFVEIAANPEGDHSAVLRAFLTAMEKKIPGTSELPAILTWFPPERLDRNSVRLVPQSVLGLSALRRGYVAEYEYGKAFIVPQDTPEDAAAALQKASRRVAEPSPAAVGDEAIQANDRYLGRLCFFRKGRYVAGFANVTGDADPVAAAKALAARIP